MRLVAVGVDDAAQLAGQQFGELVPGHGDELVGAAALRWGRGRCPASRAAPRGR